MIRQKKIYAVIIHQGNLIAFNFFRWISIKSQRAYTTIKSLLEIMRGNVINLGQFL